MSSPNYRQTLFQSGSPAAAPQPDWGPTVQGHPQPWLILGILCAALVMVIASILSITVALPNIHYDYDINTENSDLNWIVDAYTLLFAGLLLVSGWLGDHYGRRRILVVGLALFAIASVIAPFVTIVPLVSEANCIIILRGLMGVAAALIMPATLSLIAEVFDDQERPRAIAIWAAFAGVGSILGLVSSDLALRWFWWGAVFLIWLPIIALMLVGVMLVMPHSKPTDKNYPRDPVGALLSIVMIGALTFAVLEGPIYGWTNGLILGSFALSLLAAAWFIIWERSKPHPMLNPDHFRKPRFSFSSVVVVVVFFGVFSSVIMLLQYFHLQGHTFLDASLRVAPGALAMVAVSPISAGLVARFGERIAITAGLGLAAAAYGILAFWVKLSSPYIIILVCLLLLGAGWGLVMQAVTQRIVSSQPPSQAGVGSAVSATALAVGSVIGIATVGPLISVRYQSKISGAVEAVEQEFAEMLSSPEAQYAFINSGTLGRRSPDDFREEAIQTLRAAEDSIDLARYAVRFFERLFDPAGGDIASEVTRSMDQLYAEALNAWDSGWVLATFTIASLTLLTGIAVFLCYPKNDKEEAVAAATNSVAGKAGEAVRFQTGQRGGLQLQIGERA